MKPGASTLGAISAAVAPACAAILWLGVGASAQAQTRADLGSNGPIDITADQAEVVNSKCLAVWRGSAEALQGDSRLRANTISVYSKPKAGAEAGKPACGGTDRIVADGNVYYVTPQEHVRGDHAVYSADADQIVITGNVVVVQGKNVARGERLTLKLSTRDATIESSAVGAGAPGRVRAVFYPEQAAAGQTAPGQPGPGQTRPAQTPSAPATP